MCDPGTIYGLLQCTKDLIDPAYMKCRQCLDVAKSYLVSDNGCRNHKGCRVFVRGCFLRYELYSFFYNSTAAAATSAAGNYEYVKDVIKD
ncbi:hypothetical protein CASFOL_039693 [Castilleja foliolosa]|uniref:Gnk2-homologous domain-containing protein n=1 Tax=Castilleja foliolosa TaxID=1961234 RepID=A0ABD3BFY1_9LAMI